MNLAVDGSDFEVLNQAVEIESDGVQAQTQDAIDSEEQISTCLMIKKLRLIWNKNNTFEKKKCEPYMIGKVPKSTYFEKYGSSETFTKAAIGT
ncbi:2362_t:CDS:2, partial [Ambispora leptoticha]